MKQKLVYIFSLLFVSLALMAQENVFLKADSLYAEGIGAYKANNLALAIKSFILCDSINKAYDRPMPYFSNNAPQWASRCFYISGDESSARLLGDDFRLEPVDQRLTVESDSLGWLANQCLNNQDYEGMLRYALEAKSIEERTLGKDHYYCLNTDYIIGIYSLVNDDVKSMIPYLEQYALTMSRLDKEYPMLIEIYRQLIDAYGTEKLIDEGIRLHHYLREEYITDETIWPKLAEKLSGLTYNIADTLRFQNNIEEAIEYAKMSLEYSAFDNDGYNINRWLALSLLSNIYEKSDLTKSIEYTKEIIKVSGSINPNQWYVTDLWHLAVLYEKNGDINQSQKVKDTIWDICVHNDSFCMQDLYECLSRMAVNYRDINDFDKALSIGQFILDLRRQNGDTNDPYYVSDLKMLAYYYFGKADYANAFTTIKLALKEAKTILTKQNYQYSLILSDYAKIQEVLTGNHHRAVKKEKEALALMESLPTYDKTAHITILEHIAGSYSFKNELDSSIVYYNKAYEERFCFDDVTGHDIGNLFNLMATCFSKVSHSDKIDPEIVGKIKYYEEKWFPLYKDEIIKYCNSLNRSQRSLYWGNSNSVFSVFPLLVSALYSDSITNSITYDAILLSKGLLLETEKELESIIIRSDNLELLDKYNKWKKCDSSQEKEAMEIEIINKCKEFGNITQRLTTTWQDIQKNLSSNDVAIEFKDCGLDETSLVIASVIKKEFDSPKTVIVGDNEYDYANVWVEILDSIEINEGSNIYFSPDGALCQLPLEYKMTNDGRLMNETYNMYRVSSTRELCNQENSRRTDNAILYGGLKYDTDPTVMQVQSEKYSKNRSSGVDIEMLLSLSGNSNRFGFYSLPETKYEVDSIAEIINDTGCKVNIYTDIEGTEESFKSLSGNAPNILHIATHGFFLNQTIEEIESQKKIKVNSNFNASKNAGDNDFLTMKGLSQAKYFLQRNSEKESVIDYSMQRAGLVFSGATNRLKGNQIPEGVDDGLLTAKEIAQLDLHNVDLAVLSACNTGAGEITNDGVAGLQRGFKNAGVNTILMSLWKVDDKATQMLMVEFYRNLMSGKSKVESLRNAQQYLRNYTQDGEKIYSDPEYWAAFILLDALD